jgi:GWxTD domain-containing protein
MIAQSRQRIRERPEHAWPWLVIGVAEHRRGRFTQAMAAFDSGFARLPDADRARLTSLSFLALKRTDKSFDSLDASAKEVTEMMFWNAVNPTLLLPTNLIQVEFLARTVYSELRFTDDEAHRKGADTNMGEICIRYGPPDRVFGQSGIQTWVYFRETLIFKFDKLALYGTGRLSVNSWIMYDSLIIDRPVAFTNLPILKYRIDSVSTQVARFRGVGDSVDIAIFAGFRPGALRRTAQLETSTIKQGVFLVDTLGNVVQQATSTMSSSERDTLVVAPKSWFVRASPRVKAVKVEALEPDLLVAARSSISVGGFPTREFGLSDLLVVQKATSSGDMPRRWTDYDLTPLTASRIVRGEPITLVWETYEAPNENGTSKLQVAISVERETGSGLVALAGRIVGGLRNAVTGGGNSSVAIGYVRQFAATPVAVDAPVIELGRLESGRYRVTLRVTDLTTKKTMTRTQRFGIDRAER